MFTMFDIISNLSASQSSGNHTQRQSQVSLVQNFRQTLLQLLSGSSNTLASPGITGITSETEAVPLAHNSSMGEPRFLEARGVGEKGEGSPDEGRKNFWEKVLPPVFIPFVEQLASQYPQTSGPSPLPAIEMDGISTANVGTLPGQTPPPGQPKSMGLAQQSLQAAPGKISSPEGSSTQLTLTELNSGGRRVSEHPVRSTVPVINAVDELVAQMEPTTGSWPSGKPIVLRQKSSIAGQEQQQWTRSDSPPQANNKPENEPLLLRPKQSQQQFTSSNNPGSIHLINRPEHRVSAPATLGKTIPTSTSPLSQSQTLPGSSVPQTPLERGTMPDTALPIGNRIKFPTQLTNAQHAKRMDSPVTGTRPLKEATRTSAETSQAKTAWSKAPIPDSHPSPVNSVITVGASANGVVPGELSAPLKVQVKRKSASPINAEYPGKSPMKTEVPNLTTVKVDVNSTGEPAPRDVAQTSLPELTSDIAIPNEDQTRPVKDNIQESTIKSAPAFTAESSEAPNTKSGTGFASQDQQGTGKEKMSKPAAPRPSSSGVQFPSERIPTMERVQTFSPPTPADNAVVDPVEQLQPASPIDEAAALPAIGKTVSSANNVSNGPAPPSTVPLMLAEQLELTKADQWPGKLASVLQRQFQGAVTSASGEGQEVYLRLWPEQLGYLRVRISMKDNRLRGKIETSHPQASQILSQHQDQLNQRLAEVDIQLEELDISFNQFLNQHDHASNSSGAPFRATGPSSGQSIEAGSLVNNSTPASPFTRDGRVDVRW